MTEKPKSLDDLLAQREAARGAADDATGKHGQEALERRISTQVTEEALRRKQEKKK